MRYGIISDVHGNMDALNACLDALQRVGADRFICLGDVVGYGAEPNACCDVVRGTCDVTVVGNHDAVVTGRLDPSTCHEKAQEALRYASGQLSDINREWLTGLPYIHREDDACFSHGSPIEAQEFDYVFTLRSGADLNSFYDSLSPVSFVGHAHLTVSYLVTPRMSLHVSAPRFQLQEGVKYVFNVGSVGQPRDRDPRACTVLYDSEERTVTYLRVSYDIDAAANKIYAANLPEVFGQRLFAGV